MLSTVVKILSKTSSTTRSDSSFSVYISNRQLREALTPVGSFSSVLCSYVANTSVNIQYRLIEVIEK